MKNRIKNISFIAAGFLLSFGACNEEDHENLTQISEVPSENAPVNDVVAFEPELIGHIQNKGHELKFFAVGEDIAMTERLYGIALENAEAGLLEQYEGSTPFDIFVAVTDQNIEVPLAIANTAEGLSLENANRSIEKSGKAVSVLDASFHQAITEACYDVGAAQFRNKYCDAPVASTPTNIEFCDDGSWLGLVRNSVFDGWRKLDDINTWTNVKCGLTRVKFYEYKDGAWDLYYQVDFTNGIWYANFYTSTNRYRKVERIRPNSTGSFRAYTRFF